MHCHLLLWKLLSSASVLKGKHLSEHPGLKEACEEMRSRHIRSPFLLSMQVDMCEEKAARGGPQGKESLQQALKVETMTRVIY